MFPTLSNCFLTCFIGRGGATMALYSMNQLQAEVNRTPQSIRQVLKSNDKLKALLPQHKITKPNKQVFYDEEILNALKEYYGLIEMPSAVVEEVGGDVENIENKANPINTPPLSAGSVSTSAAEQAEIEELHKQIEVLQKQLEEEQTNRQKERADLEKQLQDKEAERLHFIGENSKLLTILAAEKQEKDKLLLLLPPAAEHRTFIQKLKGLFTRKEGGKE